MMGEVEHIAPILYRWIVDLHLEKIESIPLSRNQAAHFLGVSPNTIDNYRRQGKIKPAVVDGMTGYLIKDLKNI